MKINTSPISGTQELLPHRQAIFDQIKTSITNTYHLHGFYSIETPTIDRTEVLFAKAGGDTEKQIYKVVKTAEAADDADQALRFDHTVPLARYVAEHLNDLAFPFKVTQIGRNFRGERAQKGRFREFYQCDIDVIGRNQLSLDYDADVIATCFAALQTFVNAPMVIRISNRKLLTGLLEELSLQDQSTAIFNIVDHAEKVSPEDTREALANLGLDTTQTDKILNFANIYGQIDEVLPQLQQLDIQNQTFKNGLTELSQVFAALQGDQALSSAIADMQIVRGLDYYTGTVFETFLPDYRQIGSICSGGRYDNLASHYIDQSLPGVGGSIGLTRLFYVLAGHNLLKKQVSAKLDVLLIPLSPAEYPFTRQLAADLRQANKSVDILYTDKKLGDKLNYAAKIADFAAVIGENEANSKEVIFKNLQTGELLRQDDLLG